MALSKELQKILDEKNARLTSVADVFISKLDKVERETYANIIVLLQSLKTNAAGEFLITSENLQIAATITTQLKGALLETSYINAVTVFAGEFEKQAILNNAYFSKAFPEFSVSETLEQYVKFSQRSAVDLLLNVSPDAEFIAPLKSIIETGVVNGAGYAETLASIQNLTIGEAEVMGKVQHYASQISHDVFAVSDRSYGAMAATELGMQFILYQGGTVKDTRPFCRERYGKYFHVKEVEKWGAGQTTQGMSYPKGGKWQGMYRGTNSSNIFGYLGGYNCMHNSAFVSEFAVPKSVIKRNIANGNYKPSEGTKADLGLA